MLYFPMPALTFLAPPIRKGKANKEMAARAKEDDVQPCQLIQDLYHEQRQMLDIRKRELPMADLHPTRLFPRQQRRLTPSEKADCVARYLAGEKAEDLARKLGVAQRTVYKALDEAGTPRQRVRRPIPRLPARGEVVPGSLLAIREEAIRDRYPAEGAIALAVDFQCKPADIRAQAARLGVRANPEMARNRQSRGLSGRSQINWRHFSTWGHRMAYALGYIWADGCLVKPHVLSLCCQLEDYSIVECIAKDLHACGKPGIRLPKEGSLHGPRKPSVYLAISSVGLGVVLRGHGLVPRKSFANPPYPSVPDEFLPHFFRGYFDGDGCAYKTHRGYAKMSLVGSFLFMSGLAKQVATACGVPCPRLCPQKSVFAIGWYKQSDIARICQWVYPANTPDLIFLERKRAILLASSAPHTRQVRDTPGPYGRGVTMDCRGKFSAYPGHDRRRYALGTYREVLHAQYAANLAYLCWFGEAAILNPVDEAAIPPEVRSAIQSRVAGVLSRP